MRYLNKCTVPLLAITLIAGLAIYFGSCSKDISPFAPEEKVAYRTDELQFVTLPFGAPHLLKGEGENTYVEEWISAEMGGHVELLYHVNEDGNVGVKLMFRVSRYSIPSDILLSMGLPDRARLLADVNIAFGPIGTVFSPPAQLSIICNGLDLTGIDPAKVGFFIYDKETDLWEPLEADIYIDEEGGVLQCRALIDHFSRYAVAHSE